MVRFVLVGPHEGKTGNFGGHFFENGTFEYDKQTAGVLKTLVRSLSRYSAYVEGSVAHEFALSCLEAAENNEELPEPPEPEVDPVPEQGSEPRTEQFENIKLLEALRGLDSANDAVWTRSGVPLLTAVEQAYGQGSLNRRVVEEALPGWNRAAALAAQVTPPVLATPSEEPSNAA